MTPEQAKTASEMRMCAAVCNYQRAIAMLESTLVQWKRDARAMEDIVEEDKTINLMEETFVAECEERAKTFHECIAAVNEALALVRRVPPQPETGGAL